MNFISENRAAQSQGSDEVNWAEHISVILESWRLIAAVAMTIFILGVAYVYLARPVYRADAMIQVEDSANATKDALGDIASMFDNKQTAAAEIEIIRSRLVTAQTVQRLHLDVLAQPRYFPIFGGVIARHSDTTGPAPAKLGMSQFAWGGESISVSQFDVPSDFYGDKFVLIAEEGGAFILRDPDGEILLHGVALKQQAAKFANGEVRITVEKLAARPGTQFIVQRFSTLDTVAKLQDSLLISEKTKLSGVIGVSLDGYDAQAAADVINTIATAYVQQNIDRKSTEAQSTLKFLDQQLPDLRKQLDDAEERYNAFRNKHGTVDLTMESKLLLEQVVDSKAKLTELKQQRLEMAQRFTETHPAIAGINAQISALESQQSEFDARVANLPNTEQSALRLLRDVRVDTELYTNLLDSAQQLRIVKAGEVGNVRVVDFAVVPESPVKPKKILLIPVFGVVGLILGLAAAFIRKSLYGGVENAEEIEDSLGVPVYAVIPHSEAQLKLARAIERGRAGQHVLVTSTPEDVAVEGVRSLRTALKFNTVGARNNIIMVTGPRPEVGKSFLSVNLAAVLATAGERVLLIDADMRRGDVHTYFGISKLPGLSELLSGHTVEELLNRDVLPGLDVIVKGTLPQNPAELLANGRLDLTLKLFASQYDVVIVDTPPVLAVTDATIVGKCAATTLLVVRHGRHPMHEIAASAKRLRTGGVSLKGILFTDVPSRKIGYGAYNSGYYAYESKH
ncbi:Tyrosine-protein kinase ptk [Paraburkholderia aspalathi]|uniref:polysaccharide biosynthesis tyrosine autokinase n=1 Tax=Paraburkholderia aspalathi TaxID=1324617 RepID=UPI00190CE15A|nr:polysaccharide biosynthesis tyrosine autokinase [Paraburkholderia aspalathi]MBK3843383.1 polysaccharide biosynthesis tyrosine autokinase [Paraburkholderia aspalathi]CAE6852580.1 Tyrosine-protein kinase ptk [Paraburkholderia aspalathi]